MTSSNRRPNRTLIAAVGRAPGATVPRRTRWIEPDALSSTFHETYYGLVKTANVSSFKAHISAILRAVRAGERYIILDRDIPVAEVVPYRDAAHKLRIGKPDSELRFHDLSFTVRTDPVERLLQDRNAR